MDSNRRKELLEEYKNRRPEMGVISIRCKETGDSFLGISNDTKVGFNRHRFQLPANLHPNKRLQGLWNQYGEDAFEYAVVKVLNDDDPLDDQAEALADLLEQCLAENPQAQKL